MINILILGCGIRNKIIHYFKRELGGQGSIIAADSNKLAPALYDADKYFIVPRIDEDGYIDTIISICKKNNIKAVISLIDPELILLAQHKQDFLDIGTLPIISNYEIINLFFDKYEMYKFLTRNGFKKVKTYIDKRIF